MTLGNSRWKKALIRLKESHKPPNPENLFTYNRFYCEKSNDEDIMTVRFDQTSDLSIRITLNKPLDEWKDVTGFNNTGNTCLWPSAEILAIYLMKHSQSFQSISVCELGGGMACFVALVLASFTSLDSESRFLFTDGNQRCVDNLERIVELNDLSSICSVAKLLWNEVDQLQKDWIGKVDLIICSDCLFFEECHTDLIHCLHRLLSYSGRVVMAAPSRGGSLERFVCIATVSGFEVTEDRDFAKRQLLRSADSLPQIDPPVLLILNRTQIS